MKTDGFNSAEDSSEVRISENKAFDFFFRKYYTSLCYFANSILRDEEEAKDIVQECYIKLWNSQTINERAETLRSFMYTAVRNRCLNFLKRKKIIKKAQFQLLKSNNDLEYFDEAAFAEMMRRIVNYTEDLPSQMQQVFKLYYIEGKKYTQIATELKSSPEAVRKQKTRALNFIRQKFLFLFSLFTFF